MRLAILLPILSLLLAAPALLAEPAAAQERSPAAFCAGVPDQQDFRSNCFTVAQAMESAQPQLGILIASGNPTLGAAGAGGLRLGVLPRVGASLRANVVFVRLPDLLLSGSEEARRLNEALGIPAPALGGDLSLGVFPGFSAAPTVGGIGAVDLLGSATWLPLRELDVDGFTEGSGSLAYGFGARVGLLRESFTAPGVSVSLMYRRLGEIRYGDVCRGSEQPDPTAPDLFVCEEVGGERGDAGELSFDLRNWSARAAVGKRLLGLGLTAGVGYDRFDSEIGFAARGPEGGVAGITASRFARAEDLRLDSDRWSAFADLSYTFLVATMALEAGWMQGDAPIDGFPSTSDFDPRAGTWFGSLGVRVGL